MGSLGFMTLPTELYAVFGSCDFSEGTVWRVWHYDFAGCVTLRHWDFVQLAVRGVCHCGFVEVTVWVVWHYKFGKWAVWGVWPL